ncbi:MAG: homocysteine S-methyltransferase family protein [Alphaproteobacteria bacterium]
MRTLSEALDRRVLLCDGSLARQLRAHDLDEARDFLGVPDGIEALSLTRARLLRDLHIAYLEAGADVVRTNTLAASPLSLRRFDLGESAFCINYSAAEIACEAVDFLPGQGRRRFVLGVVRDQGWDEAPKAIEDAVSVQVEGLLAGGADGIALDMLAGTGRARVFLMGAQRAKERLGARAPVFLQRSPGGAEFSQAMQALADGVIDYRNGHAGRSGWLDAAIQEDWINLLGGGDTPADTARLDAALRAQAEDGLRPVTAWRRNPTRDETEPASSTLYPEMEPV